MKPVSSTRRTILAAAAIMLASPKVFSQKDWPNKPIKIIVPFAPGGIADTLARLLQPYYQIAFGQPIIIENRTGASGTLATSFVAKSAPDGYTFLLCLAAPQTLSQHLSKLDYDGTKDFAPVSLINTNPLVVLVNPSLPVNNIAELIAYAKANPGKLNFSGAGGLTQFAGEILKAQANINMIHIPYKGGAPAVTAAAAGETQLTFANYSDAIPWMNSGKLRAIAVTSAKRFPLSPNIPTISETLPGFFVDGWSGIVAPAATPKEIINKFSLVTQQTLKNTEVRKRMEAIGATPIGDTPEEFQKFIQAESLKWANFVKQTGIKVD
jgi:tripartite-type tricarboxylate transporter receptor subunit TctC